MENRKAELNTKLDGLKAKLGGLQEQALEMVAIVPQRVADKLRANAKLILSTNDFDSDYELHYRLDVNDNSAYPDAATLIEYMRQTRQAIHNLKFKQEQDAPSNTMTC
jgi:hypothetical protein